MSMPNIKLYLIKRKQRLSVFGISPLFDWRFILSIFEIVLAVGIVYAVLLYVQISNGSIFESTQDANPKVETEQQQAEIQNAVNKLPKQTFDEQVIN